MRSAAEIISDALREEAESDERWAHITELHRRNDEETYRAALDLLDSSDPERRTVAVDILAQLGSGTDDRRFAGPATEVLLELSESETDTDVLQSIATAFGHLEDPRSLPVLHRLRTHPHEDVRFGVVFGLLRREEDLAIEDLIELSGDVDEDVRDWATFGLGAQTERDDEAIRAALSARLDDPHYDTRAEAICGLAVRGDESVIPHLLNALDESSLLSDLTSIEGDALLALAATTGDPRLCRLIGLLHTAWADERADEPMPEELAAAIEKCRATSQPDPADR
jgi:HEAT repeat protein